VIARRNDPRGFYRYTRSGLRGVASEHVPWSLIFRVDGARQDSHPNERLTIYAQQEAPMAVRKSICSRRPLTHSGGRRPPTHPVRPAPGYKPVQKSYGLQHVSLDEELLLKAVMLALRLRVIHRTTLIHQLRVLYLQGDQHVDMAESLSASVCNPLSALARVAEEIAERLGGKGIPEPPT